MERLSLWRLHPDAVSPSVANVEVDAVSSEARGTPPFGELRRFDACCEHALLRRLQNLLQMKEQATGVARHASIIRWSARRRRMRENAAMREGAGMSLEVRRGRRGPLNSAYRDTNRKQRRRRSSR
jgi:hypothetical protein